MKIVIIIPTFNEGGTIGHLIDQVFRETASIKNHEIYLLIVDGNSVDDTAEIVKGKKTVYKNIDLLTEKEKRGLGAAYITGMKHAIEQQNADVLIEFDGDFQHNPKDILKLIVAFDQGYDYVIGSRYIPGGSIPQDWPWYRKFLSSAGNIIIKYGLRLETNDNTSGFKLTRVQTCLPILPLSETEVVSLRHAYKIHFLYNVSKGGLKITEVPIKFLNRDAGLSKSTFKDVIESLKVVLLLNLRKDEKRINKITTNSNQPTRD